MNFVDSSLLTYGAINETYARKSDLYAKADTDHTHTMSDITDLSTSINTTIVNKTYERVDGTVFPFMKLTADQLNKFEGIVKVHLETVQGTYEQTIYLQITAIGDFIINPVIFTTEVSEETTQMITFLYKCTHNESGDILLYIFTSTTDSYGPTVKQITIEGTTNSPTDIESLDDCTYTSLTDSTKYYSTISYKNSGGEMAIYSKVGYATG